MIFSKPVFQIVSEKIKQFSLFCMALCLNVVVANAQTITFSTTNNASWSISKAFSASALPQSPVFINGLTFPNAPIIATTVASVPLPVNSMPIMDALTSNSTCISKFVKYKFNLPCKPAKFQFDLLGDDALRIYINGNLLQPQTPATIVPNGVCGLFTNTAKASQMGYLTTSTLTESNTNGLNLFNMGANTLVIEVLDLGGGHQWVAGNFSITNVIPTATISGNLNTCSGTPTTLIANGGGTYKWNTGATTAAITVNPAVNTTYIVTVTNAQGCSAIANQTVIVNPKPVVSITGNTKLCQGTQTTLTAIATTPCTGAYTYLWNTGAVTQSITTAAAGTYTCKVTCSATGCSNMATTTVYVLSFPTIILASQSIKCNGTSSVVSLDINVTGGTPAYTYQWSNGATTQDLNSITGTAISYCVKVTDQTGCSTKKCFDCLNPCAVNTNMMSPLPTEMQSNDSTLPETDNSKVIFTTSDLEDIVQLAQNTPNPFSDKTRIIYKLPQNMSNAQIIITDLSGKLFKTISLNDCCGEVEVLAHDLSDGTLFYSLVANGKIFKTNKMVVIKN